MQYHCLRAFPAITQEEEFPRHEICTVNFYLSTFPAEINDKMFQNKGKTVFLGYF